MTEVPASVRIGGPAAGPRAGRNSGGRSDHPGGGDADERRGGETRSVGRRIPDDSPQRDLDEARRLITALAGLVTASAEYLGPHAGPVRDGLKSLQLAFRESSAVPDEPGQGPGEKYTGPVR